MVYLFLMLGKLMLNFEIISEVTNNCEVSEKERFIQEYIKSSYRLYMLPIVSEDKIYKSTIMFCNNME